MSLLQLKDEELLAYLTKRDEDALDVLYDRYATPVFTMALRIVNDRPTAEEIVQETFLRIWRQANSYNTTRGRVASWVFSIAHNLAVDELRKRRSRPVIVDTLDRFDGNDEHDEIADIPDGEIDVADAAWQTVRAETIRRAIDLLPRAQREVVELAYFQGLTHREIAARLNQPLGTVKTRLLLAMRKLRDEFTTVGLDREAL